MNILIGADPEVFVKRNGVPYSAHGMVPGTKAKPHKVQDGAVQVDGLALEYNITPADTSDKFVHNIRSVFKTLEAMIPADCRIEVTPSIDFDWDHIKAQPKEALELGCDPDYNAYTRAPNPRPDGETNMRTASGHIHIGWTNGEELDNPEHVDMCFQLVRELDFWLGIPSVILDPDVRRRQMYGKAGACRIKPYGVEYRVLSNFWLKDPAVTKWVFEQTMRAVDALKNRTALSRYYGHDFDEIIQTTINDSNVIKANELMKGVWNFEKIFTFGHLLKKA